MMGARKLIAMLLSSALLAAALPMPADALGGEVVQAEVEATAEQSDGDQELEPAASGQQDTNGSYGDTAGDDDLEAVVSRKAAKLENSPVFTNESSGLTDKTVTKTVPYLTTDQDGKETASRLKVSYTQSENESKTDYEDTDKYSRSITWSYYTTDASKAAAIPEDVLSACLNDAGDTLTLTRDMVKNGWTIQAEITYTSRSDSSETTGTAEIQVVGAERSSATEPQSVKLEDASNFFTFTGTEGVPYEYRLGESESWTAIDTGKAEVDKSRGTASYTVSVSSDATGKVSVRAAATDLSSAEESDTLYAAGEAVASDDAFTAADLSASGEDKYASKAFTAVFAPASDNTVSISTLKSNQANIGKADHIEAILVSSDDENLTSSNITLVDEPETLSGELKTLLSVTTSSGKVSVPTGSLLSITSTTTGSTTSTTGQYLVGSIASTTSATLYDTTASGGTNAVYTYNSSSNTLVKQTSTVTLTDRTQTDCGYVVYEGVPYQISYMMETDDTNRAYLFDTDGTAVGYAALDSEDSAVSVSLHTGYKTNEGSNSVYYNADGVLTQVTDLFAQTIYAADGEGTAASGSPEGKLTVTVEKSDVIKAAVSKENPIGLIRTVSGSDEKTTYSTNLKLSYADEILTATVESAELSEDSDYLVINEQEPTVSSLKSSYAASTKATASTASSSSGTTTTSSGTSGTTSTGTTSANTGDESSLVLWAGIMVLAAAAAAALVMVSRRKKKKR